MPNNAKNIFDGLPLEEDSIFKECNIFKFILIYYDPRTFDCFFFFYIYLLCISCDGIYYVHTRIRAWDLLFPILPLYHLNQASRVKPPIVMLPFLVGSQIWQLVLLGLLCTIGNAKLKLKCNYQCFMSWT